MFGNFFYCDLSRFLFAKDSSAFEHSLIAGFVGAINEPGTWSSGVWISLQPLTKRKRKRRTQTDGNSRLPSSILAVQ
jgi:hypothetical protein